MLIICGVLRAVWGKWRAGICDGPRHRSLHVGLLATHANTVPSAPSKPPVRGLEAYYTRLFYSDMRDQVLISLPLSAKTGVGFLACLRNGEMVSPVSHVARHYLTVILPCACVGVELVGFSVASPSI